MDNTCLVRGFESSGYLQCKAQYLGEGQRDFSVAPSTSSMASALPSGDSSKP
jgi:hypothetical protein